MARLPTFNPSALATAFGISDERDDLAEQHAALLAHWSAHPWNWLMGEDLEERQVVPGIWSKRLIWTTDEKDTEEPVKAFPNYEYLYRWICALHREQELLANKPRQMIFTTSTLQYVHWLCLFSPARNVLLSKQTQDLAEQLLLEKIKNVHERLPLWVRTVMPLGGTQSRIVYNTRSTIRAVAQNVAERDARGGTASMVLIDEAATQDAFQDVWAASTPMCDKVVAITTAKFGTRGGKAYADMLGLDRPEQLVPELINPGARWPESNKSASWYAKRADEPLKGYQERRTERGFLVIELALQADPAKRSAEVLAELERRQPNRREFMREFLGDWTTASGSAYYPEFDHFGGVQVYKRKCVALLRGVPIEVGIDFGIRCASVCWVQRDPTNGRLFGLRELLLRGADTYVLRELMLYLSGQLALEEVSPKSSAQVLRYLDALQSDARYPDTMPWFDPGLHFRYWSSREALRTTPTVEGEGAERHDAAILEARGISLTALPVSVKARENIVRNALKPLEDGVPGLLIDPACPELLRLFGGGLVFAKESHANPMPDVPQRDGWFHDLHDGFGYAAVGAAEHVSDVPVGYGAQSFRVVDRRVNRGPQTTEARVDLWNRGAGRRARVRGVYGRR